MGWAIAEFAPTCTILAELSDAIGEGAIGTTQHAGVGGVVVEVVDFAAAVWGAVGGIAETANAIGVTESAVVGVRAVFVLP